MVTVLITFRCVTGDESRAGPGWQLWLAQFLHTLRVAKRTQEKSQGWEITENVLTANEYNLLDSLINHTCPANLGVMPTIKTIRAGEDKPVIRVHHQFFINKFA